MAYIEALCAARASYAKSMALVVFSAAAIVAWAGRERRGIVFGES
ncbi:MAG: hypothetical protein ACR2LC_10560 [Pyrinomonadaceae bacterium]